MLPDELRARKAARLGQGLGDTNGLSWSCNYVKVLGAQELIITQKDRAIIRDLAKRVAEIAARPEQAAV